MQLTLATSRILTLSVFPQFRFFGYGSLLLSHSSVRLLLCLDGVCAIPLLIKSILFFPLGRTS